MLNANLIILGVSSIILNAVLIMFSAGLIILNAGLIMLGVNVITLNTSLIILNGGLIIIREFNKEGQFNKGLIVLNAVLIMFRASLIIFNANFVMLQRWRRIRCYFVMHIQDGGEHSRHVLFRRRKAVPSPGGEHKDSWLGYRSRLYRESHYIRFMWVYYFKSPIKWVLHTE